MNIDLDERQRHTELLKALGQRFRKYATVLSLDEWNDERRADENLSAQQKQQIVNTAIQMLQNLYVHMDLKRTRRGVNPVQQLNVFLELIDERMSDYNFHNSLLQIFKTLGDVHTAYRLPSRYKMAVAFLPFAMNSYYDQYGSPRYIVSHSLFDDAELCTQQCRFHQGIEVTSWNGVAIAEAVKRSADFEEGSNVPHDLALGLQFMTVRWLGASFAPDSPWVLVGFRDKDGFTEERFFWSTLLFKDDPKLLVASQASAAVFNSVSRPRVEHQRALYVGSDIVHAVRLAVFKHGRQKEIEDGREELGTWGDELSREFFPYVVREKLRRFTSERPRLHITDQGIVPTLLPEFLEAQVFDTDQLRQRVQGDDASEADLPKRFGYIRIRAFPMFDPDSRIFKYEFRRLLHVLPPDGLVIDIRDNPGGSARNAEMTLQFLTPHDITPLPFRFIASPLTKKIAQPNYQPMIGMALATGNRFSAGLPITPVEDANGLGQHYFGPVVLITNAMTYSAGDIFAAGFEDNDIGPIIGLDETTGAGGANCWFYDDYIAGLVGSDPLPDGINMQFAVRQCARVGTDNAGLPIEEIGVTTRPERRYSLTKADVVSNPRWLPMLFRSVQELALSKRSSYDLETIVCEQAGHRRLKVLTSNITRLDFLIDGRPTSSDVKRSGHRQSIDTKKAGGPASTRRNSDPTLSPAFPADRTIEVQIHGYAPRNGRLTRVARYIETFSS
jgi:C-terminal processing protease CtpA/Prc